MIGSLTPFGSFNCSRQLSKYGSFYSRKADNRISPFEHISMFRNSFHKTPSVRRANWLGPFTDFNCCVSSIARCYSVSSLLSQPPQGGGVCNSVASSAPLCGSCPGAGSGLLVLLISGFPLVEESCSHVSFHGQGNAVDWQAQLPHHSLHPAGAGQGHVFPSLLPASECTRQGSATQFALVQCRAPVIVSYCLEISTRLRLCQNCGCSLRPFLPGSSFLFSFHTCWIRLTLRRL